MAAEVVAINACDAKVGDEYQTESGALVRILKILKFDVVLLNVTRNVQVRVPRDFELYPKVLPKAAVAPRGADRVTGLASSDLRDAIVSFLRESGPTDIAGVIHAMQVRHPEVALLDNRVRLALVAMQREGRVGHDGERFLCSDES